MTGEQHSDLPEPEPDAQGTGSEFDDASFILEDWDDLDEVVAKVENDVGEAVREAAEQPETDDADPDASAADALFGGALLLGENEQVAASAPAASAAADGAPDGSAAADGAGLTDEEVWSMPDGAAPDGSTDVGEDLFAEGTGPEEAAAAAFDGFGLDDMVASAEDVLFEPRPVPPSDRSTARTFSEDEPAAWGGADKDIADLGIPVEPASEPVGAAGQQGLYEDPLAGSELDADELEIGAFDEIDHFDLVDEVVAPAGVGASGIQEVELDDAGIQDFAGESGFFASAGFQGDPEWQEPEAAQEGDGWEAQDEGWDDAEPVDGDQDGDPEAGYDEADYDEADYDEAGYDEADYDDFDDYDDPDVAGHAEGDYATSGGARGWLVAAAAAALLLVSGGLTAWTLLGDGGAGAGAPHDGLQHVAVARPAVDLDVAAPPDVLPRLEVAVEPPQPPVDPQPLATVDPVDPVDPIEVAGGGDPTPVADPGAVPEVEPAPPELVADPVVSPGATGQPGGLPVVVVTPEDPAGLAPPTEVAGPNVEVLPIGEQLAIGGRADARTADAGIHEMAANLAAGDRAFAELRNGNLFVGSVKAMDATDVTLRLERGEITLAFAELRNIGMLDSPEFAALSRSGEGSVRLNNDNRIGGSIRQMLNGGGVAIELSQSRVIIPESAIREITQDEGAAVKVDDEADQSWIRQLVEDRLRREDAERAAREAAAREAAEAARGK